MKKLSGKLIALFTLVMLLLGWTGWGVLRSIFPDEIFAWYPYIPAVFLVMGLSMIITLAKNYKIDGKKLVNVYMVLKLLKLVTAMVYMLGFYFTVGKDIKVFGFTFAAFYAAYIGIETYIFSLIEKQIKKEE